VGCPGAAERNRRVGKDGVVTRLLEDAREQAAVLSKDADEMEALTRSDVSWESHAYMLDKIKEDVNNLGRTAESLKAKSTA
jgi:hypothetical protein